MQVLNLIKTKIENFWLEKHTRIGKLYDINIIDNPTKVLEVWLCKDIDELININLDDRITKLQNLHNLWKQRNLTIKSNITILRSQALPIFLFISNYLYVPDDIVKKLKILYNCKWPNGNHHVKKLTLIEDIKKGGLKMPDIASMIKAIKLTWIKILI